jgi:hypothetical protein
LSCPEFDSSSFRKASCKKNQGLPLVSPLNSFIWFTQNITGLPLGQETGMMLWLVVVHNIQPKLSEEG